MEQDLQSTHMCLQISIGEQALQHLAEASADERQKDSGDGHVVPGLRAPRRLAAAVHRQLPRDMTHWDLVRLWVEETLRLTVLHCTIKCKPYNAL